MELATSTNPPLISKQLEESNFLKSIKREPERRNHTDVQHIYYMLRSFSCLSRLDDNYIYTISQNCYYKRKQANDILYCRGEIAHSWFVLVTGSVFIDGSMFLPVTCFGRRPSSSMTRRPNECLILEPSEMICVDYYDNYVQRSSIHSDSSSAYSGSDTMLSSNSTTSQNYYNNSTEKIDLTGLQESVVDSDNESNSDSDDSCSITSDFSLQNFETPNTVQDMVRNCLEKDPTERTENDILILLEFTQHLAAFNDLTLNVRKSLCAAMVFAVVEKAGTIVLSDGEELDSWSVLVNGAVEVELIDGITILSAGDSFGLPPTLDKQYFKGTMRTRSDDCQFVCVTQTDYFRILKQGLDNQQIIRDSSNSPILIYEIRTSPDPTNPPYSRQTQWIIRGTKPSLISELFKETPTDPTYVEDFLLTQRIFMDIHELAEVIIQNFSDIGIRDRVTRVMLLWVNNHFIDFEVDLELMNLLQKFQLILENYDNMAGQLRLLQIACSAKSRSRSITIKRVSREDPLPFNIMGGCDSGYGVFVSYVEETPNKDMLGMRIGDELLSVNNTNFRQITLSKAFDILKGSTHLVIVLKCNFLGYHECINSSSPLIPITIPHQTPASALPHQPIPTSKNSTRHRFKKALQKINLLPKKILNPEQNETQELELQPKIDFPENVLKIYRPDGGFKYFLVNKETTAREVVMLAVSEFADLNQHTSRDFALFQVSVNEIQQNLMLKQTRLPENLENLAERLELGSRYYIKRNESTEPLVSNELLPEIFKESEVNFCALNPKELALQLTLEDYACFRQIEMTEFIDDLFGLKTNYGTPNLNQFAELVNRETFWVVTEITNEHSVNKRMDIVKRFVKVALQCRECRNFNSMFAIISGLGHSSVSRLRQTWDKLSNKYQRLFKDLQDLMDPSRNMGKYRSLLASSCQTPMIPFYPVVKKDLTFIDLGNSTYIDKLINFEKMRMVSKEIRSLVQMSAAPFDTSGQPTMAAMNQLCNQGGAKALTTTTGKNNPTLERRKSHKKNKRGEGQGHRAGGQRSRGNQENFNRGQPNPKKMFEDMNMIRKVKAYLSRLTIISDENMLHELSLKCEPGSSTSANSVIRGTLKRNPVSITSSNSNVSVTMTTAPGSPTLSTTSSSASTSSRNNKNKFGTGSPGSYQKLLSLSEPGLKNRILRTSSLTPLTAVTSTQLPEAPHGPLLLSTESSSVLPATTHNNE